jgi:hypothetical protein
LLKILVIPTKAILETPLILIKAVLEILPKALLEILVTLTEASPTKALLKILAIPTKARTGDGSNTD